MDLWRPYTAAVRKYLPKAKIVYDKFHFLAKFSRVIDKIRRREFQMASQEDRSVIKGTKYLLFKHKELLCAETTSPPGRLLNLMRKHSAGACMVY